MRYLALFLLTLTAHAAEIPGVGLWFQRPVGVAVVVNGRSSARERKAVSDAVDYAIATWQSVCGIQFERYPSYPTLHVVLDNTGILQRPCVASTTLNLWNGIVLWGKITLNGRYGWGRPCTRSMLRTVLIHEFGHVLGLSDVDGDAADIMDRNLNLWGEITSADLAVVQDKYGMAQVP